MAPGEPRVETYSSIEDAGAPAPPSWIRSPCVYPSGTELFLQGDTLEDVLQIVSGVVKLTQSDASGGTSIVGLASAGEWLGTAFVLAEMPTAVGAATCGITTVRRGAAKTFRRLLNQDRQLSLQIHLAHSRDLCRQIAWIGQLGSSRSVHRLQYVLSRFAAAGSTPANGLGIRFQLPVHHWELAEFIGVSAEHLSRLLKRMERQKLIRREKGWILIADLERLTRHYDP